MFVCFFKKPVQCTECPTYFKQFAACIRLLVSASITYFAKLNVVLIWQKHLQARVCSYRSSVCLLNPVSVYRVFNLIKTICNLTAYNNFLRLPIFFNLLTNEVLYDQNICRPQFDHIGAMSACLLKPIVCRVSSSVSRYCYFYVLV